MFHQISLNTSMNISSNKTNYNSYIFGGYSFEKGNSYITRSGNIKADILDILISQDNFSSKVYRDILSDMLNSLIKEYNEDIQFFIYSKREHVEIEKANHEIISDYG